MLQSATFSSVSQPGKSETIRSHIPFRRSPSPRPAASLRTLSAMLSGRLPSITSPKTAVVTAVACLLLLGLASHLYSGGVASRSLANTHDLHASPVEAPVQASPDPLKPRRDEFGGVVVHWLLPTLPKLTDERTIRHVLLLFHGCTHQGLDWFTFPEERIVVQAALRLGFGVAAFTSADRWSGCWDNSFPPKENIEAVAVRGAFNALTNAMATEVRHCARTSCCV